VETLHVADKVQWVCMGLVMARGVGTGGGGHRGHVPPPNCFQRTKSALFCDEKCLLYKLMSL
jgi:hypothetical protein